VSLYSSIPYKAFGQQGEFTRDALTIGELPHEMRQQACVDATAHISQLIGIEPIRRIFFGRPAYVAFGLCLADAKRHQHASILMKRGADVPLHLLSNHNRKETNMKKHNPAPWSAHPCDNNVYAMFDGNGQHFMNVRGVDESSAVEANVSLVTAAPGLLQCAGESLAMLEGLLNRYPDTHNDEMEALIGKLCAAICGAMNVEIAAKESAWLPA